MRNIGPLGRWCLIGCLMGMCLALPAARRHGDKAPFPEKEIPSPEREFRGVWVASVANIDWPSRPGLTTEEQKAEIIGILEKVATLNMNAVILQVRPQADALYHSDIEPWSAFLTGKQGQAPDPVYDPLEFWTAESHRRGLELHAWFNPYRANHPTHPGGVEGLSARSIVKAHPDWTIKLGEKGYYWMDPSLQAVQDHTIAVILDVVRRYDVDGVHLDDYFYPYQEYNDGNDFPDEASWMAYRKNGGALMRNDWRREAVNKLIQRLYHEIKAGKPHCKFGISPFGIWRPGHPASIRGLDQYDRLFADARLWLKSGWVDYFTPQLYWPIRRPHQSFPVLLGWWKEQNQNGRHLWPGMTIGQSRTKAGIREVISQIQVTRGMVTDGPGQLFFSMRTLQNTEAALAEGLLRGVEEGDPARSEGPYQRKALIPASPWLDASPPAAPEVSERMGEDGWEVSWQARGKEPVFLWVLYLFQGDQWTSQILPADSSGITLPETGEPTAGVAVSAVDRTGNESPRSFVEH